MDLDCGRARVPPPGGEGGGGSVGFFMAGLASRGIRHKVANLQKICLGPPKGAAGNLTRSRLKHDNHLSAACPQQPVNPAAQEAYNMAAVQVGNIESVLSLIASDHPGNHKL